MVSIKSIVRKYINLGRPNLELLILFKSMFIRNFSELSNSSERNGFRFNISEFRRPLVYTTPLTDVKRMKSLNKLVLYAEGLSVSRT